MRSTFIAFVICWLLPGQTSAQNGERAKEMYLHTQSSHSEKNFPKHDSLKGFDEAALAARLLASGVYGSEYANYMAHAKRSFINQTYKLAPPEQPAASTGPGKPVGNPGTTQITSCVNEGFEQTAPGTYTAGNAVTGWSIGTRTVNICGSTQPWTAGSPEFSIVSTPIIGFPVIGTIPHSPLGGTRVAWIHDAVPGFRETRISQNISVTNNTSQFTFAWAGVLQTGHPCCDQPHLEVQLWDCTRTFSYQCLGYSFYPATSNTFCPFSSFNYTVSNNNTWTQWQLKTLDLSLLIGNCITVDLIVSDCKAGGHYGSVVLDYKCGTGLTSVTPNVGQLNGTMNYCAGSSQAQLSTLSFFTNYQWYVTNSGFPGTAIPQATNSSITVSVSPLTQPPNYYVTMTTSTGCNYIANFTLAPTQVSVIATGTTASCSNGSSGSALVYAMGSGTGYNYAWMNSTNSVVGTSSAIVNMPPGVYSVSVSAQGSPGCGSSVATVTIHSSTIPSFTTLIQPYCSSAYFNAPPGTNFQWYHNSTPVSAPQGTNQSYTSSATCPGCFFQVAYTGVQGCRDSIEYALIPDTAGIISAAADTAVCPGAYGSATLSLQPGAFSPGPNSYSISSVGGSPPYSVTTGPMSANLFTLSGVPGGATYSVTAFDGGCYTSATFSIGHLLPPFDFTLHASSHTICTEGTSSLNIHFTNPASPSQYTYSWTPSTYINGSTSSQTVLIQPTLGPGTSTTITYSAVVTPSAASCPLTRTIAVTAVNLPAPLVTPVPPLCSNAATVSISATPPGGTFAGSGAPPPVSNSGIITPSMALPGMNSFSYSVSLLNCVASVTGSFLVNPAPVLTGIASLTICPGETHTLVAGGAASYQWSHGAAGPFATVAPVITTAYTVTGMSAGGQCSDTLVVRVIVSDCTAIDTEIAETALHIYPNPTTGMFVVEAKHAVSLVLSDATGKIVLKKSCSPGSNPIDISNYSDGLYFLRIVQGNRSEVVRLVVDRK